MSYHDLLPVLDLSFIDTIVINSHVITISMMVWKTIPLRIVYEEV